MISQQEPKTHPELTVVSRILQQASISLTQAQFDQQWTPTQLRTAFNWTRHLSAMFLTLDDNLSSLSVGQQVLTPQRIVRSFLRSRENASRQSHSSLNGNSKYGDNRSSSASSSTLHHSTAGNLPTEAELLDPSSALQRRLLRNPGLTDMARLEILSLNCPQQQQEDGSLFEINSDALSIIKENALDDLIAGARTHFLQLSRLPGVGLPDLQVADKLSNMTTKSIKQRAKARVLFNRIEASNDTTMEVEMVLIPQLRKYLEVSRSEAWDVICDLSDMATKAIRTPITSTSAEEGAGAERSKVDWESVVDALARLQCE